MNKEITRIRKGKTAHEVKKRFRELLKQEGVLNVSVVKVRRITHHGEDDSIVTVANALYVAMGDCTSEEFEAIKKCREIISKDGIEIINLLIDL